jgi:hypothetical protein
MESWGNDLNAPSNQTVPLVNEIARGKIAGARVIEDDPTAAVAYWRARQCMIDHDEAPSQARAVTRSCPEVVIFKAARNRKTNAQLKNERE